MDLNPPQGIRSGVLVCCPFCKQHEWQGRVGNACEKPECRAAEARVYERAKAIRAARGMSPPPDPDHGLDP
jgi:hypothetical protein